MNLNINKELSDDSETLINDKLEEARIYIDIHFNEQITLKIIAANILMNERYFIRIFNKRYNITPHQYIIQKRIQAARSLIRRNIKIGEICRMVGYEDISSFSKLFKKLNGQSPLNFLKSDQLSV